MAAAPLPTLVVVSGPPASGKATLAHAPARKRLARVRSAHADGGRPGPDFERLSIPALSLVVDTIAGYVPDLAAILAFVDAR